METRSWDQLAPWLWLLILIQPWWSQHLQHQEPLWGTNLGGAQSRASTLKGTSWSGSGVSLGLPPPPPLQRERDRAWHLCWTCTDSHLKQKRMDGFSNGWSIYIIFFYSWVGRSRQELRYRITDSLRLEEYINCDRDGMAARVRIPTALHAGRALSWSKEPELFRLAFSQMFFTFSKMTSDFF